MPQSGPRTPNAGANLAVELGPAILFMVAYNLARRFAPEEAIFLGAGVFMAATVAALGYAMLVQKRVPPMLLVTAAIVLVFGGLTLWLHNEIFVYLKPTIINLLFATAIFGGLAVGRNPLKLLLGEALTLPEPIWRTLALRFGCFYVFLAGLNEVIWRNFSEAFWVNFKVLGVIPISIGFMLLNAPLLSRYMNHKP